MIFASALSVGCNASDKVDKEVELMLESNPTTGYDWVYEIQDESIVGITERQTSMRSGEDGPELCGGPSLNVYTFEGKKEGVTSVHFEYKRAWEDRPAEKERRYKIMVDQKGKVVVEEMKDSFLSLGMEQGLKLMAQKEGAILVDVRRPDEYSAGHIPGAVQMTNETMSQEEVENLLTNKGQYIFVYCRSGRRSKEAAKKLVSWGYKQVYEIGGILDYCGQLEK